MNDVLVPLCQKYHVNLITGAGELSITSVVDLMRRAQRADRPARILYIADYDPAGHGMPVSIARKIEHFQRKYEDFDQLDIRLEPIVLTVDQVAEFSLPRTPVKATDLRKDNWEAIHGPGAVELDALEALHPGQLRAIVKAEMLNYYDTDLIDRAGAARTTYQDNLNDARGEVIEEHEQDLYDLSDEYDDLKAEWEKTREQFAELVGDFETQIEAYRERLESIVERHQELCDTIESSLENIEVDTPEVPRPELPAEGNGTLYASDRDYIKQLQYYKSYREGAS